MFRCEQDEQILRKSKKMRDIKRNKLIISLKSEIRDNINEINGKKTGRSGIKRVFFCEVIQLKSE